MLVGSTKSTSREYADVVEQVNSVEREDDFAMIARRVDMIYAAMGAYVLEGATEVSLHAPPRQYYEVTDKDR